MAHEDFAHLTGDGSVAREIWGQEHSIKAETFRSNSRHRRTDSKLSGFVGSGADNGATTPPSDDDRLAAQLRIVALFDRRIKGVHVDMNDLANGQGVQCPGVSKTLISFRNSDEFMKTAKCPPLIVANLLCAASMPSTKALPMPAGVTKSSRDLDRKSTRMNSSHPSISYAVFCLKIKRPGGITPGVGSGTTAPGGSTAGVGAMSGPLGKPGIVGATGSAISGSKVNGGQGVHPCRQ